MNVNTTTLANGLRVVTVERPQTETVALGAWVNTGSACESAENNGVSHFVEHMVFKGTQNRTAKQIYEDVENVGGQINAYTSREMTVFYVKMLKEDAELGVDVVTDFIMHPQFPEDEMDKERDVIIQEIRQTNDDPSDIVFDYFQSAAFANQALGMSILGPEEKVKTYTPETLRSYMTHNYAAENIVFAAVGNISHQQIVEMVEKRMSDLRRRTDFLKDKQRYTGGQFIKKRDTEQAQVVLGFPGIEYNSPDYYPAAILSSILGGGMSSRLFQEVREKRGLVYSVYSFSDAYSETGLFGMYAGLSAEGINDYITVVLNELKKISSELVDDIELQRTKAQFKAGMLSALESSFSTAELIARQSLVYNRIIPTEETVAKINRVTREDILRVAATVFSGAITYTILGNVGKYPSYESLSERLHG